MKYEATLISKDEDEDDNPQDSSSGTFTVTFGTTNTQIIDLVSDELWPDRGHIEFTVANP